MSSDTRHDTAGALGGWQAPQIVARAYQDLVEGSYVNLGIGLPTALLAVAATNPKDVVFQSENGILGLAALPDGHLPDDDLIDAGKNPASLVAGGCYVSHADSFGMIRGGHIDVAVLGAYEVAANGDFANWSSVPGNPLQRIAQSARDIPAVGGAIDLAAGARSVVVVMKNIARGPTLRFVQRCTLPLTGTGCVTRIYSNAGVLRPTGEAFVVDELADGVDLNALRSLFNAAAIPLLT